MAQGIDLVGIIGIVLDGLRSERHAQVLRLRLGTESAPPMTLEQVGAELGVTRERARQLEEKALDRLTASIRRKHPDLREAVIEAMRPEEQGYEDRIAGVTALVAPDWPARVARKLMMRLAGKKVSQALADQRSMRLVYAQGEAAPQPVTTASRSDDVGDLAMNVYEAVAARFQVEVDGSWKRFSSKGWFYVGQSVAGCPGCKLCSRRSAAHTSRALVSSITPGRSSV